MGEIMYWQYVSDVILGCCLISWGRKSTGPKPESRNLSKKLMFSLFSLDLKKKTWLGDDQFFVEMWYSATYLAIPLFIFPGWDSRTQGG